MIRRRGKINKINQSVPKDTRNISHLLRFSSLLISSSSSLGAIWVEFHPVFRCLSCGFLGPGSGLRRRLAELFSLGSFHPLSGDLINGFWYSNRHRWRWRRCCCSLVQFSSHHLGGFLLLWCQHGWLARYRCCRRGCGSRRRLDILLCNVCYRAIGNSGKETNAESCSCAKS